MSISTFDGRCPVCSDHHTPHCPSATPKVADDEAEVTRKAKAAYEAQTGVYFENLPPHMQALWKAYVRNGNYLPPR